jgi:leucyl aminopeptidase
MNQMKLKISKEKAIKPKSSIIYLVNSEADLKNENFSKDELSYLKTQFASGLHSVTLSKAGSTVIVEKQASKKEEYLNLEEARKQAFASSNSLNSRKETAVSLVNLTGSKTVALAYAEGFALSNYQFLKYFEDAEKRAHSLKNLYIVDSSIVKSDLDELTIVANAVYEARTLVNEPLSYLTAEQLSSEIKRISKKSGFQFKALNKKEIEKLGMGGLLAVNLGTPNPPTFNIMEWKPEKAVNKKPIVLVGKGVVYDTGGLSLKPTKGSMDSMKADMGGAAAVIGTIASIAENKLPVHVVGLVPATENRPDGLAYTPGDVIKMMSGLHVEVLNTDAEGRMILADALHYAKRYKPELVIDLATLTGAAAVAIGANGIVAMGNAADSEFDQIAQSGFQVFERIARFPFWDDYSEMLKSDIADMKNIGGREAGAITAGKFLERFTDYPYVHLDIAGPAFLDFPSSYRLKGGSGVGIRLLYNYFKNKAKKK